MVQVSDRGGDRKEILQKIRMVWGPRARDNEKPKRVPGSESLEDLSWKK